MKKWITFAAVASLVAVVAHAADAPKPSPEQAAMMEKMTKAMTPGPQHEMLKKWAGEWNAKVTLQMDPSQPPQVEESTSTLTMLMDGRYCQEVTSGHMMGQPFNGLGITGYDNVLGKYVSTWIDNMGTGILTSTGTPDASGKVITWVGLMADPMTGKVKTERMVTRIADDDHRTFEMYGVPPGGKKEMKMMTIEYSRK